MQRTLLFKCLIIGMLAFLLGIPLMMIQSTISERMSRHEEAVRSIAADSVREQTVAGPVLVIPYTDEYQEDPVVDDSSKMVKTIKRTVNKHMLVFPNDLKVNGGVDTDTRYRGIHKVLVYSGQYSVSGDFVLPSTDDIRGEKPNSKITLGKPFVSLPISDVRGVRDIPKISWNGAKIEFEQGSGLSVVREGLHAPVPFGKADAGTPVQFSFGLVLDGSVRMNFAPVAKNNHVTLTSKWPHPQFSGQFLPSPKDRKIDNSGFTATWKISSLATNTQQQFSRAESLSMAAESQVSAAINTNPGSPGLSNLEYFSVAFIEPVNIYSQADRAVKYGLLFVALTFAAFFLFEVLKQLPIHPIQYLLVGLALALFFLLLVSLSEHIEFLHAYLIASGACILLIGFYLAYVLRNWKRGLGFGIGLTVLYGVLYGLLSSENNALVMGSILLFAVLSAVMITTRKVDWYQIGKRNEEPVAG
jgi:inner membrane protein